MAGAPIKDRLGRKGGKQSVWVSAADQAKLEELGITSGEALRRGLASLPDPVSVPESPELAQALELVSRLSQALAKGGKLVYPAAGPAETAAELPYLPEAGGTGVLASPRPGGGPVMYQAQPDGIRILEQGRTERLVLGQYSAGMSDSDVLMAAAEIMSSQGDRGMQAADFIARTAERLGL